MRIEQCIVTKSNQDGSNRLIFSPRESLFELRRDASCSWQSWRGKFLILRQGTTIEEGKTRTKVLYGVGGW